jgi:maltoporin
VQRSRAASRRSIRDIAVRALCALSSLPACALDTEGYLRVGSGKADDPKRACYDLDISGGHYRLGNECDFYGELGVSHTVSAHGATHRAMAMVNLQRAGVANAAWSTQLEQIYAESRGLVGANDLSLWLGKRFYGRLGVHILDTWFVRLDGVGFGADDIALAGAKLGVAYFRTETDSGAAPEATPSDRPGRRLNIDLRALPLGQAGTLRVTTAFTRGHDDAATGARGTNGFALSVQHDHAWEAIGGSHTAWLQYAQGSAGLDANFGTMTASPHVARWRLVESLTWQAGAFGGQAVALFGRHDQDAAHGVAARYAELSIGGRVSYAVTPHIKLVAESGYMEKRPEGSGTQRLAKLTFAPTWSTGPGFWNRPELRLYVTLARWNDAANAGAGLDGLSGLGDGRTRGTSWGVQLETWF